MISLVNISLVAYKLIGVNLLTLYKYYQKEIYLAVYSHNIQPVASPPNWISSDLPPLIPPHVSVQIGRPRKERRRAAHEPRKDSTKTSKSGFNQ